MENVPLWHERDISHSSVERVIAPDATILGDFMLHRLTEVVRNMVVYDDRMRQNLELTRGLIFSEWVLISLVDRGLTREQAYVLVQRAAMKAWDEGLEFKTALIHDIGVMQHLDSNEIEAIFNLDHALRWVNASFARVFGQEFQVDRQIS